MQKTLLMLGFYCLALLTYSPSFGKEIRVKQGESSFEITANSYTGLSFELDIAQFELREIKIPAGIFTDVVFSDAQHSIEIGYPRLPRINRLIEIPKDAEPVISILFSDFSDINLAAEGFTKQIYPAQGPLVKSATQHPFHINQQAYLSQDYLPSDLVSIEYVGEMRGVRIARISINPFAYAPAAKMLRVCHSLKVQVSFQNADIESTLIEKEARYSPFFENTHRLLWNYKPISGNPGGPEDVMTKYPVKYVIVADSMFRQTLQPFVQWKRRKGFIVVEAYKQNPGVGSTTTSIKSYLQGLYNNASPGNPAPSFVLFVGDVAQLPAFSVSGGHVTDRNYCEYTNDALPEVYYGRFSATNIQQLQAQVEKTLEYEQYLMQDPGFLNNVVLVAGSDATYGPLHANGQINYGKNTYFNTAHGLYTDDFLYPASSSNAALIRQLIGSGVAFANYTAHGDASGWANPSFNAGHVASMTNSGRYPLMIGNACLTNKFDSPECFGEALLRASNKGAIGYIGGSNNTYWDEDYYWSVGLGPISSNPTFASTYAGMYDRWVHDHGEPFQEWFFTQAQMMFAGNLAVTQSGSSVNYYWEIYHLMGDPSLMPYLGMPDPMPVTYNALLPLGLTQFVVNAVPYAYVAITRNDTLYGAVLADSNGVASLTLQPFTTAGVAEVVATAQNYQPFIGTLVTASPTGPYLSITGVQVTDTAGNSNSLADYSEEIVLDLNVENLTNFQANSVTLHLTTADTSMVTLIDTVHTMPLVSGLTTVSTSGAFKLQVKDFIPDGYQVPFTVYMSDNNNGSWSSTFKLLLNAPRLKLLSLKIDDSTTGNGNGRLDPGENLNISLVAANLGHADAGKAGLGILSNDARIILSTNGINVNQLKLSDTLSLTIPTVVDASAPHGLVVALNASIISGLYSDQKLIHKMIGNVDEDFETGNLSRFAWVAGGSQGWVVDNSDVYEGSFAAHSPPIGDQQTSSIAVTMNVIADDSIYFHRKVSSESYYDFLEFYIDGSLAERWSGTLVWERVAMPVSAGLHEFKWTYAKDYYLAAGQDRAWIDNIVFPPNNLWAGITAAEETLKLLKVYPNPSSGQVMLELSPETPADAEVRVIDASGRTVYSSRIEQDQAGFRHDVDLGSLGQGIYHVQVIHGNARHSARLVIIKK